MTPTLTFTKGELGREIVRLGDVVIGDVAPYSGARHYNAIFSLRLPDTPAAFRPTRSFGEARELIRKDVSEWFLRAGVFYPEQLIEVAFLDAAGRLCVDQAVAE
jgi:hypothetical protein